MTIESVLGPDRTKHLDYIQAVVSRMATCSFLVKGWTLTISSALFAVTVKQLDWGIGLTALIPIVAFWFLDGYFLWQERLYRCLYDDVRDPAETPVLLSMDTRGYHTDETWPAATFSKTLSIFYGALALADLAYVAVAATSG